MSRKYVCDRCKEEFNTWSTTNIEIPAATFMGSSIGADLCSSCLNTLRGLFHKFMETI